MRLGTSTTIAFNRPGGRKEEIPEVVRICAEAGYKVLDMNFHDCANFSTPLLTDKWQWWVDKIADSAAKYGVEFSQSHLHFYEFFTADDDEAREKEEIIRRCMEGSAMLGVKWAVTHAATAWDAPDLRKQSLKGNVKYFTKKLELAEKLDMHIAIENLWDLNIAPKKRYTSTAEELLELVEAIDSERIGIAWDFEHASIMGQEQLPVLRMIGSRLKATHVSDQYGILADHQIPYFGETKWEEILPVLREINYEGDFVYETHRYTQNMPDELLLGALRFSVEVGDYLLNLIKHTTLKEEKI